MGRGLVFCVYLIARLAALPHNFNPNVQNSLIQSTPSGALDFFARMHVLEGSEGGKAAYGGASVGDHFFLQF